ncbi:MAG: DUF4271 domain-containing protein [Flavobacteriales bacterium]|nr:DUF4271 domain-containing protein [Flavobacteriales bacterium]
MRLFSRIVLIMVLLAAVGVPLAQCAVQADAASSDSWEILRPDRQRWWMFLFAVLVFSFIGLLRNLNSQRHQFTFFSYVVSPKTENELLEDNYQIDIFQIIQIGISCLIIGWFISLFNPFDLNFTMVGEFGKFLLIILLVALVYSFKYFVHFIIGIILQSDRLSKLMVFSQSNMMYAVGLILFPLILILAFAREPELQHILKMTCFGVIGVMLIMRFIKTFRIYLHLFPYRRVYIFIYLCALEILPLLVMLTYINWEWI